ncbi:MAG: type VI secretion system baseplate subunit TssK [Proteobacteria bacterium]|nr:type VI secretion system baseplate subunit TssK [Pseudomonadota bacterium]
MSYAQPLWGEGLFLRPQHFQQQDAYIDAMNRRTLLMANPFAWGIRELELDREALGSGILRFNRINAVFANGDTLLAPDTDQLPAPLSLNESVLDEPGTEFLLALPHLNPQGGNCAHEASSPNSSRYLVVSSETCDLFSGASETEIAVLSKIARIRRATEPNAQFQTLPLVRICRTSSNGFEVDPGFIPPSISLRSNAKLQLMLQRQIDALLAKVDALYGLHREPSKNIIEFRSGDIASFWLLHTASTACAALSHLVRNPDCAPERLFQELLRLAGGLLTFSRQHALSGLPGYDHLHPGPCFARLDALIRELLDTVIPTQYFAIALTQAKPSFHSGRLDSDKIDDKTRFYLSVRAAHPQSEIIESVPFRLKLGAPDDVEKLVLSAMAGVRLTHAAQVPAAIPVRPGASYFSLDGHGPLYERMLKAQSITIYVPESYQDLELELIALTS